MRRPLLRGGALREPEVANARAPVEAARRLVVLVRIIERAIVHRIDCDIAVIAPAIGRSTLAAGPVEKMLFARQNI